MFIKSVLLRNFRNYEKLSLEFKTNRILLVGKNAQGKTNLLESLYYLSCLGSNRAKSDSELIRWNESYAHVSALICKQDLDVELSVLIHPPQKREIAVNNVKKRKSSEFCSNLCVVSFSVSDLLLLRGAPDDRRSWLDLAISQIYPAYPDRVAKYNKIRIQKNNYLKELRNNPTMNKDLLDVWNTQLAVCGSNIIYLRLKFLAELQKIAQLKHSLIANNESLSIQYNSSVLGDLSVGSDIKYSVEEIAGYFQEKLLQRKEEEIIRSQSLVGPHRDDISYYINEIDSKKFASQGQQRTIVLSLKLAELELIKQKIQDTPVLLLDDVLAELDNVRQNFLLNAIGDDTQTIITSVDTVLYDEDYLKNVEIYKISDGAIV